MLSSSSDVFSLSFRRHTLFSRAHTNCSLSRRSGGVPSKFKHKITAEKKRQLLKSHTHTHRLRNYLYRTAHLWLAIMIKLVCDCGVARSAASLSIVAVVEFISVLLIKMMTQLKMCYINIKSHPTVYYFVFFFSALLFRVCISSVR